MRITRRAIPMLIGLSVLLATVWIGYRSVHANLYQGPMRWAIFRGDHARLEKLLREAGLPATPGQKEGSLLHLAVLRQNTRAVRLLLEHGADARAPYQGRSILVQALSVRPDPEMIRLLLDHGADCNGTVRTSSTIPKAHAPGTERVLLTNGPMPEVIPEVLTAAAGIRNLEILRLLLDRGASMEGGLGDGPLFVAINGDWEEGIRHLAERGVNINARLRGSPALVYAARIRRENAGKALLAAGAEVDALSPEGRSVLMEAARAGSLALVRLLLQHGARIDLRDRAGLTALDHGVRELERQKASLEELLRKPERKGKVTPSMLEDRRRWLRLDERRDLVRLLREAQKRRPQPAGQP